MNEIAKMTDAELDAQLRFMAERERRNLAGILEHIAEYDKRRLAEKGGFGSTFMYCMRVLRYDDGGAYRRLYAARVVRKYPQTLPLVSKGELTLTSLLLLAPIIKPDNCDQLIGEAKGLRKRELEALVAKHHPRPGAPDSLRRLPAPPPAWSSVPGQPFSAGDVGAPNLAELPGVIEVTPPREWQAIMPLSIDRIRVGFDAGVGMLGLIKRATQILRHKFPEGKLEDVVKEALEFFLDKKDPQRKLAIKKPEPLVKDSEPRLLRTSRAGGYVPAAVKSAVWKRDDGRCTWRFEDGLVCGSREFVEFDHVRPVAEGGRSDVRNLRLLCRVHNQMRTGAFFSAPAADTCSAPPAPCADDPGCSAAPATPSSPSPTR